MNESIYGRVEHWIMSSRNGYRYMSFRCPICKIWVDGPVFIEDGGVHFIETWPTDVAHEMVEIASGWQKRLAEQADFAFDRIPIHVQMVNLDLDPDWPIMERYGFIQFYLGGEPVEDPVKVYLGEFDAVVIHVFPDEDRTPEQLEELILHELLHAAFPKSSVEGTRSRKKTFGSAECEKWINDKTTQLLRQHGYLLHQPTLPS